MTTPDHCLELRENPHRDENKVRFTPLGPSGRAVGRHRDVDTDDAGELLNLVDQLRIPRHQKNSPTVHVVTLSGGHHP